MAWVGTSLGDAGRGDGTFLSLSSLIRRWSWEQEYLPGHTVVSLNLAEMCVRVPSKCLLYLAHTLKGLSQ